MVGNFLDWCLKLGILFYLYSSSFPSSLDLECPLSLSVSADHSVTLGGCQEKRERERGGGGRKGGRESSGVILTGGRPLGDERV